MNRNQEVIDLLSDLVRLTTLDEGGPASFRVRAYENAVRELEDFHGELEGLSEKGLAALDGIGKSTAKKIREYFQHGRIQKLEDLRAKYPPQFVELTTIPGLGPKKILLLRDKLGVQCVDDLRQALASQRLRELEGFGAKTEENLIRALERTGVLGKNMRRSIAETLPVAEEFVSRLAALDCIERATYCGSLRRFRETIGDIDIVAVSVAKEAMDAFVEFAEVEEVLGHGEAKSSVIVNGGMQVDLRVVDAREYGAAILYFTGSKAHNIRLRQRAIAREMTLNEYGLNRIEGGGLVASGSEEEIYSALDLDFIPPPMREDHGEVEAAASRRLPACVRGERFRGGWFIAKATQAEVPGLDGYEYAAICGPADAVNSCRRQVENQEISVYWAAIISPQAKETVEGADFLVLDLSGAETGNDRAVLQALEDSRIRAVVGAVHRESLSTIADVVEQRSLLWIVDASLEVLVPGADVLRSLRDRQIQFAIGSGLSADTNVARRYGPFHCQRGWIGMDRVVNDWTRDEFEGWLTRIG